VPESPALGRSRQEHCEFKSNPNYTVRPCLKKNKKMRDKENLRKEKVMKSITIRSALSEMLKAVPRVKGH
jgi:hypothetical protein